MTEAFLESAKMSLPLSSPLLALTGRDGGIRVWSCEWLGLVCSPRPTLTVSFGSRSTAGLDPRALALFGVSLPPDNLLVPPWLPALLIGAGNEVLGEAGFAITLGTSAGAPLVGGCPLQFECRNGTLAAHPGTLLISAEVVAIHLAEVTLGPENWPELGRIRPLTRLSPAAWKRAEESA